MAKGRSWRALAVLAAAAFTAAAFAQWWIGRPKRAAERFISLVSTGAAADAAAMLADPSAMRLDAGGTTVINAGDGSTATLAAGEMPLIALGTPGQNARAGWKDYLAGRYRFQVATFGPAVESGDAAPVEIDCRAEGGEVIIEAVR